MDIKNLFDDLEKVKKELWHLIKKVVPRLEELIGNSNAQEIQNIKNQLASQLEAIEEIESNIFSISQTVGSHENGLSQLTSSVSSINSQIAQLSSAFENMTDDIETNTSSISSLNSSLSKIEDDIEANSSAISDVNSSLSSLQDSVELLSSIVSQHSSSILSLRSDIVGIATTASSAENAVSGLSNQITTLSNTITTNTSKINALEQQIENLSSETVDVLYDMYSEDSAINHNFTSGMKGGNYLQTDFSQYKKIRIYARLYNANAVQEFFVKNRKLADMTLIGVSATPTVLSFLKVQMNLEPYLNRFQVMAYAKYVFSTSSGTFTLDFGMTSNSFYVYRIEGIK